MAQCNKKIGTAATNSNFAMTHAEIDCISEDKVVMYACIVNDFQFQPQKEDPTRVRITAGRNLVKTPGYLTARTVLSTDGAEFAGFDISNFYLGTDMECYQYMRMPVALFPQHNIDK